MGWFERQQDGSLKRWYVKPVKEFFSALLEEVRLVLFLSLLFFVTNVCLTGTPTTT